MLLYFSSWIYSFFCFSMNIDQFIFRLIDCFTSDTNRNNLIAFHLCFPSGFAIQLSIRDRSYPTRITLHVGTFGFTAEVFLIFLFVTHVNILTSDRFFFSKSYRLPSFSYTERSTTSTKISFWWITASVSYLVSCIFGAESLILYVVTRFLTDGCFQAHCQVVFGIPLPFALSMKFETLSINLGCFPLNAQYLSTAVGLRSSFLHAIQFTVYTGSVHFDMPSLVQSFTLLHN